MNIDFDVIRELLAVFSQTNITELTIESGEEKITVKKSPPVASATGNNTATFEVPQFQPELPQQYSQAPNKETEPASAKANNEENNNNGLIPIASPMVGTFYRSPNPTSPAFVDIGDRISVGQTICIIEAMKLMNDLPSEIAGRIARICVENGTTVEYGQPLFMIDPNG